MEKLINRNDKIANREPNIAIIKYQVDIPKQINI